MGRGGAIAQAAAQIEELQAEVELSEAEAQLHLIRSEVLPRGDSSDAGTISDAAERVAAAGPGDGRSQSSGDGNAGPVAVGVPEVELGATMMQQRVKGLLQSLASAEQKDSLALPPLA